MYVYTYIQYIHTVHMYVALMNVEVRASQLVQGWFSRYRLWIVSDLVSTQSQWMFLL